MAKAERWRGSPIATTRPEFMRLVRTLQPSKNDIFYDVGCGYGLPCLWIANKVKLAVGIENFAPRYKRALINAKKSSLLNIRITKKSFQNVSFSNATIVHCVILFGLKEYRKIQKETSPGAILALCYPPMYPIKSRKANGYYLIDTPFKRVKDEDEYARIVSGKKSASIQDIHKLLGRQGSKSLKWQISHADFIWRKIYGK